MNLPIFHTNTKTQIKYIPISATPNFKWVEYIDWSESTKNNVSGLVTSNPFKRTKALINMSLIAKITLTTIERKSYYRKKANTHNTEWYGNEDLEKPTTLDEKLDCYYIQGVDGSGISGKILFLEE